MSQFTPQMLSLSSMPDPILGHIYQLLEPADRCSFSHTCKTLHEAEDITQRVRALTLSCDHLENMAVNAADFITCFPASGKLQVLTMKDFFKSDGIFEVFSAFSRSPKARGVLADVHTLHLEGYSIDNDMLAAPLALMVSLLLPKLQHLEFVRGSDPLACNFLAPSFLSPDQPGGLSPSLKLSTLTIETTVVLSVHSLLGNIGGLHHLTHLVLEGISVSADAIYLPQHHVCDLAPLVGLQALQKLKLTNVGIVVNCCLASLWEADGT
ncbi:hypothetical protein DUNSADRAFT_15427 [Dunaliella salina]|uniref:F-box domain-containing protein n=1 Tax=Dunaliella salina TaxID=3046 RepID=A0ABQ7G5I7_DUNSA|nr:hypothetical protein DUNSADRAFT_15427 [Dunaliella salina]|eukprot:KAF5829842.1 hypothetical protein DUNSADRAFT_15427 [Dunaliella salina]